MREAGYGEMAGVNLEIRKSGFDVTNPENAARCAHGTRGKRGRWNHSCAFASLRGSRFAKRFLESVLLIRAIRGELRGVRDGLTPSPGPRRTNRRRRRPSQPRHGPRPAAAATPSPPLSCATVLIRGYPPAERFGSAVGRRVIGMVRGGPSLGSTGIPSEIPPHSLSPSLIPPSAAEPGRCFGCGGVALGKKWGDRRDLNPRPQDPQSCALTN